MPKLEAKQVVIDEIKSKLEKATSVVLVDARGVTVGQDTVLRKSLREAGVEYKTYKNSMIEFAVKGTQFEPLTEALKGPTTVAFTYEDPTVAASILSKSMEEVKALEFKASVIDGVYYDAAKTAQIAKIPSREVLISKLLGSIKSPVSSFARVLKQIAEKTEDVA